MQSWEYKFIDMQIKFFSGTDKTEVLLNELGKDGWEAILVWEKDSQIKILLKRQLQ